MLFRSEVSALAVADGVTGYVRIAAALITATFGGEVAGEETRSRPLAQAPGET